MRLGIAGTDENKRVTQARAGLGIAGEVKGKTEQAAFGISGVGNTGNINSAKCAIAGPNTRPVIASANGAMGIAGNFGSAARNQAAKEVVDIAAFKRRDEVLSNISRESQRLGDQAAREAWRRGLWFADFTYVCTPYGEGERGVIGWRRDREFVFGRQYRDLPFFIDSCGYRREITGTAPRWAHDFDTYLAAIELLDPDGYAAWDFPGDRPRTLDYTHRLIATFPDDVHNGRLWPVFSIRWAWCEQVHLDYARLPGWASRNMASLIPLTRTQKQINEETRERWARQAIANALKLAVDQDFLWMVNTFGQVMLGGMVSGPCPRMARHLFAATLCHLFPDVKFWLLGQANFATINGLGRMGLLDQVYTDGTWWIKDATAERMAIVEDGLITMLSLETNQKERRKHGKRRQFFFTLVEMMAANLRSLLAAYEGLWQWPPPEPLPIDLMDTNQVHELKARYQVAQLELGL